MKTLRATGRSGSALPGLIIERLNPTFLTSTLKGVQGRVVLVTGTNGKTTTTQMLVAALRGAGQRVTTNAAGSNMTRGLIAALVEDMTYFGSLRPTDWFVFEMDEAYAPLFTKTVKPQVVVGLNVLRDQLDRYGEIDTTAKMIGEAGASAKTFVYNALDPLLAAQSVHSQNSTSFGTSPELRGLIANEQTLHGDDSGLRNVVSDTTLCSVQEVAFKQEVVVEFATTTKHTFTVPVQGFHNALNAAAVAATIHVLLPEKVSQSLKALASMPVPFGRGEQLHLNNKDFTVALVKNPSGLTANLKTFIRSDTETIVFAVNDRIADGRDVSWLWDVDFESSLPEGKEVMICGIRAYDMAVRLKQAGFQVSLVEQSIPEVLSQVMKGDFSNVVIIPTYTALFEVRSALTKYGEVPRIW